MSLLAGNFAGAIVIASTVAVVFGCRMGDATSETEFRNVGFNEHVRPILSDKCYSCHGPDSRERQADLRLDVRASAVAGRDGGPAIVPGDTEASQLVQRIRSVDPEFRMPPPGSRGELEPSEIDQLSTWIEQGAEYEEHWSYLHLARPDPPHVRDEDWIANPIDRFILAMLEERGIAPSPGADPTTLARRLSFDLTGLPPTHEEVQLLDRKAIPEAYADAVDRFLESPHFGERMAVFWLDLVRYADTNGYNADQHRHISPYRDYVIDAFNSGMSFHQFTVEQLAGDLLPSSTVLQRVASGYNRLNMVNTEAGAQAAEFIAVYAADRVRTTASVWMGATLGCAQCHDHKFDPYTAKDFYRFAAFFADIQEEAVPPNTRVALPPEIAVSDPESRAKIETIDRKIEELNRNRGTQIGRTSAHLAADIAEWKETVLSARPDTPEKRAPFDLSDWSSFSQDQSLALGPAGRFVLTSGIKRVAPPYEGDHEFLLDIASFRFNAGPEYASRSTESFTWSIRRHIDAAPLVVTVEHAIDGNVNLRIEIFGREDTREVPLGKIADVDALRVLTVWHHASKNWEAFYGINGLPPDVPFPRGPLFDVSAESPSPYWTEELRVEGDGVAATLDRHAMRRHDPLKDPPPYIIAILRLSPNEGEDQYDRLVNFYLANATNSELIAELQKLEARKRFLESSLPKSLVTVAQEPRVVRVLSRGNWMDNTGEIVSPAVPAFLPALPVGVRADRLALAQWLVSPNNPLAARVFVNRLWKLFFGQGIAPVLDDLGSQGGWPTQPLLLDWLAYEFVDSGWDVKHVIRLIVSSTAYRQSSAEREDLRSVDPENTLFARQSHFRLDAELIRDNALAISGLLSRKVGGRSVKPYQPDGYWGHVQNLIDTPATRWIASKGKNQYRRGLYTYWKRTFVHPSLRAFDAPTREECIAERPRSSTPLQALVLLNDPTYVEAARSLSEKALKEGGSETDARIRWAFRKALSRDPKTGELRVLRDLHARYLDSLGESEQQSSGGPRAKSKKRAKVAQSAALTAVCRVLLNLNETITRY